MFQKDDASHGGKNGIETIIGSTVKVNGNFSGSGDVSVEGSVIGTLKTTKNLRIGETARVKADIAAENIFIAGEVRGNVVCKGKLELTGSAKVIGNVETQSLAIAAGALLHGKVSMMVAEKEVTMPEMSDEESKNKTAKK